MVEGLFMAKNESVHKCINIYNRINKIPCLHIYWVEIYPASTFTYYFV